VGHKRGDDRQPRGVGAEHGTAYPQARVGDSSLRAANTRIWRSATDVGKWAFGPPWARSATPTTTRWRRASSPRSSASCWIGADGRASPKRGRRSSRGSKAGTTRAVYTRLWALLPIKFEKKHRANNDRATEHGLPTAAFGSSQAPTAAVDNPAPVEA
jgi:2-polyprenyl-6-methoxyphenol hydroxylase-like FAD-dependent oxidoreductase